VAGSGTYELRASAQDGTRLRPQLLRDSYRDLSGRWGFAHDDAGVGEGAGWADGRPLPETIVVPFPPDSPASGVGAPGYHPVVWYRREISADDLAAVGFQDGQRLLVHFGAVDYRARVWLNGVHVGEHEGGHTPFALDVTDALAVRGVGGTHVLVVRAEDDPRDVAQPRGKQDWRPRPHAVWYHRTTGIWQPVWLEAVAPIRVEDVWWTCDLTRGTATAQVSLSARVPARVRVTIAHDGAVLGETESAVDDAIVSVTVPLDGQGNGQRYEELVWRPGSPVLLDAWVSVHVDGVETDVVASYLGLRSVHTGDGRFWLNDRPFVLRSVLSQGYWPTSHLAAPSADALRQEAELVLALGFNAVRVHQKIEDPRFLFHADRLGLLVWGEMPAAYAFSDVAVRRTTAEWTAAVVRDRSHPCVVTWVPLNESWGIQHVASRADQRAFAESLYHLTKALDPTRPVISNDGWEHGTTDLWTLHDYEPRGEVLAARYGGAPEALRALVDGVGPAGRRTRLAGAPERGQPVMLTEFGGVKWSVTDAPADAWGYSEASDADDFAARIGAILAPVLGGIIGAGRYAGLAGWCWTQLTDTAQERNGLLTEERVPKLPIDTLRRLIDPEPRSDR